MFLQFVLASLVSVFAAPSKVLEVQAVNGGFAVRSDPNHVGAMLKSAPVSTSDVIDFWHALKRMKANLEVIANTTNRVTQEYAEVDEHETDKFAFFTIMAGAAAGYGVCFIPGGPLLCAVTINGGILGGIYVANDMHHDVMHEGSSMGPSPIFKVSADKIGLDRQILLTEALALASYEGKSWIVVDGDAAKLTREIEFILGNIADRASR